MASDGVMLDVKNVSKSFGQLVAVKEVSMTVPKGAIHGLIGPNGSGKTTMFNLLSGFLRPTSGTVHLSGHQISGLRPHRVAAKGLVRTFQLTSIYQELTALQNVVMGHHLQLARGTVSRQHIQSSASRILGLMGLEEFADTQARLLPAGTQRVLSIATAVAAEPNMLLLDEPLAGLNATEKAQVVNRISAIRDAGMTILLVEHDVKSVVSLCEWITVINFGSKIAEGLPADVVRNERVIEAYLGKASRQHA